MKAEGRLKVYLEKLRSPRRPQQVLSDARHPAAFSVSDRELHGGTRVSQEHPLHLSGPSTSWSYIASWPNRLSVCDAIGTGLRLELTVELLEGKAEVGLVAGDFSTFLHRADLVPGSQNLVLETGSASSVRGLVLRNRQDSTSAAVKITGLRTQLVQSASAKERGFLAKNAVVDLACRLVEPDLVVVDVGANRGDTVEQFSAKLPLAKIWALEPHPDTFRKLQKRFVHDKRVEVRNLALSDRDGRAIMHSYTNAAINSLSPVTARADRLMDGAIVPAPEVDVELRTLKSFCEAESIDRVDILKLDTQGHENAIINGSLEWLASGKVRYVLAELIFAPLYARQAKAGEVIALLERCGFKIFDFYDFVYNEDSGLKWGDALFEFVGGQGDGPVAG